MGDAFKAIFEEWHRQWVEEPEAFASRDEDFARTSNDYGSNAARTFRRIASDLGLTV